METKEIISKKVDQGRNIRTSRIGKNMKQETLAQLAKITQSTLSKAENSKIVDDELLKKLATALDVPFQYLKEAEEEASTVVFENNTLTNTNQDNANDNNSNVINNFSDYTNIFNPIEKMIELYERLITAKDEKYTELEKRIQELELKKND